MERLAQLLANLMVTVMIVTAIPGSAVSFPGSYSDTRPRTSSSVDVPQQSRTGPLPPPEVVRQDAVKPVDRAVDIASQTVLPVPSYLWRHGCGPTALGMVVGYYDGRGHSDLIPGSADNQTVAVTQAIASGGDAGSPLPPGQEQHYEDYACPQDSRPNMLPDDYINQGRTPHPSDSIADYMNTSRSSLGNYYGWSWSVDMGPAFVNYVNQQNGTYQPSYRQYSMYDGTLTWSLLVSEIDAGHPMVFLVDSTGDGQTDHFVTVIGYRTSPTLQYGCWDTWSNTTVRWENFAPMGAGAAWGIWGGWAFGLNGLPGKPGRPSPADGATDVSTTVGLIWTGDDPDSGDTVIYTVYLDTSSTPTAQKCSGSQTSCEPGTLDPDTVYYWKVVATDNHGASTDGDTWHFRTLALPADFSKTGPVNGVTGQPADPTLTWDTSSGAASYEYCYDTTDDNSCSATWTTTGTTTSASLSGLMAGTTYYWQVRARNGAGTTDAGGGWWGFTTMSLPAGFSKTFPPNAALLSLAPTLGWTASSGAASYEYCYDTTNDGVCSDSWTNVGNVISAQLNGLSARTTYYWQVRASNSAGNTDANSGAWWSYTIAWRMYMPVIWR